MLPEKVGKVVLFSIALWAFSFLVWAILQAVNTISLPHETVHYTNLMFSEAIRNTAFIVATSLFALRHLESIRPKSPRKEALNVGACILAIVLVLEVTTLSFVAPGDLALSMNRENARFLGHGAITGYAFLVLFSFLAGVFYGRRYGKATLLALAVVVSALGFSWGLFHDLLIPGI
jgi:hypothetical protein